eukprot:scaffold190389_cov31-Tisochrysis_lutea.AAC.4
MANRPYDGKSSSTRVSPVGMTAIRVRERKRMEESAEAGNVASPSASVLARATAEMSEGEHSQHVCE